ncbi:SH3 domain-containing protein [Acinetobacter pittii]|uniref:SH3 domain-containing protein n=1 Tax=Acinetobacter calcoaceticus/baumannii complex TaxID=909768 RepID=UPI00029764D6|nr:SH3 domain-containing protein [Acinetobacter baumannii]EKP31708.1 SH3 domain protein [Acinetobacter baumannii OIFC099]MBD0087780.1 SH3 domain-containing protein [Acinetobacter baumannii]MDR0117471.1 SH3 domain-containing protein [Acinetobacter baumannii]HAV3044896.1 SH3 domain-containing protein [Acinetobacter baumannii]HCG3428204.1 SH3 domain-containing protein [Acinetobacter baumannii]
MNLDDELKRVFRTQNEFSERLKAFNTIQNKNSAAKLIENFINKNHIYQKFNLKDDKWNKFFNNSMITDPFFEKYKISADLIDVKIGPESFFKIFNNEQFIEEFIRDNRRILNGEEEPQESDLNVFGEKIINGIKNSPDLSQDSSNFDPVILINGIIYILFIICWLYVTHLDEFNNFEEAMVFYINSIECKGVTTSAVNLRSEPNIASELILTIPKDSGLKIYDESQNGWVKVKVNLNDLDFEGYVSEAYIRRIDK